MAYSRVTIPGDGTTTQITASFALGYINQSDVTIHVTGEIDGGGDIVYRTYSKISDSIYQVNGTPCPVGEFYVVERTVSKEQLIVDWEDDEPITDANLNLMQKQSLMVAQEAFDLGITALRMEDGSEGVTIERGAPGTMVLWDAGGNISSGPTAQDIADAQEHAADALASAAASAVSAGQSAASAVQADGFSDLAEEWATKAEDVPVTGTGGILFSAKHWALKAYANVLSGFATAIHGAAGKTTLNDADELGIADSVASWVVKKVTLFNLLTYLSGSTGMGFNRVTGCETVYVSTNTIQMKTGWVFFNGRRTAFASALTKSLASTFTAGNAGGFLDTGVMAASKTYFVHALRNTTTGAGDWVASLQSDPALVNTASLSGWVVEGRVNVVLTTSGNVIRQYTQDGNEYRAATNVSEITAGSWAVQDFQFVQVPAGISTEAIVYLVNGQSNNSSGSIQFWTDNNSGPQLIGLSVNVVSAVENRIVGRVRTRSTGVLRGSATQAVGSGSFVAQSMGFVDYTVPRPNGA